MEPKLYTIQRLKAFLKELAKLKQSEFPYIHSEEALSALEVEINRSLTVVENIPDGMGLPTVLQRCSVELNQALDYHPLLGLLLRSTNVRNSFEVFKPILRMARSLMQAVGVQPDAVRVILASEWEYSPYVIHHVPYLKGYVLVGMPASESSNPLIIPLAGHEIGHTVWMEGKYENKFKQEVVRVLTEEISNRWSDLTNVHTAYKGAPKKSPPEVAADLFLMDIVRDAYPLAIRQLEETFCDVLGLRLFGESFLFGFAYLISPAWGEYRVPSYPNTKVRASNLQLAAQIFKLNIPANYIDWFEDRPLQRRPVTDSFTIDISDASLARLVPVLIPEVEGLVGKTNLVLPTEDGQKAIGACFLKLVPAQHVKCLGDIINAGWIAHNEKALWPETKWTRDRQLEILKDLMLKTIEIHDIETIVAGATIGP